jgi:hypothetical protein
LAPRRKRSVVGRLRSRWRLQISGMLRPCLCTASEPGMYFQSQKDRGEALSWPLVYRQCTCKEGEDWMTVIGLDTGYSNLRSPSAGSTNREECSSVDRGGVRDGHGKWISSGCRDRVQPQPRLGTSSLRHCSASPQNYFANANRAGINEPPLRVVDASR